MSVNVEKAQEEKRTMTIARGLTRLKTIKAQLSRIALEIGQYGVWNDKKRHPYGDNNVELKKNHNQAKEKILSLFQQYDDLVEEFVKIKTAIEKANISTKIVVAGKVMTISQALMYKREVESLVRDIVRNYDVAVDRATKSVNDYNSRLSGLGEEDKEAVMADILYLVPQEKMEEKKKFLMEFLEEVDGTLNEVNAVTEIVIE